jgi:hypothetical protein
MYHVIDKTSPKDIWKKLKEQFMSKTLTWKLYPKLKLYGLKMQEGSDLAEHFSIFDVKIDDEDKAIIFLCSLSGSYEHLVTTTLKYGKDDVKVDETVTALLGHEQRRKNNLSKDPSRGAFWSGVITVVKIRRATRRRRGHSAISARDGGIKRPSVRNRRRMEEPQVW